MIRLSALAALLPAFVATPLVQPALAQEACTTWSVGMQEDEGGPVLTAEACATDRPDAWLSVTCFDHRAWIRYDLAAGAEASPEPGEQTDVVFDFGETKQILSMLYEDMDGRHAGDVAVDGLLVSMLKSGKSLSIVDAAGRYPVHAFSLDGSSAAIGELLASCR